MRRAWQSERDQKILERVKAGETMNALAAELGVTRQRIQQIVQRLGLIPRLRRRPWPDELSRQAQALHAQGLTYRQIAGHLNMTRSAVIGHLNRLKARSPAPQHDLSNGPARHPVDAGE